MRLCLLAAVLLAPAVSAAPIVAQEPTENSAVQGDPIFEVVEIALPGAGDRADQIRAALSVRVGDELTELELMNRWRRDVEFLWSRLRVRLLKFELNELDGRKLQLRFECEVVPSYRRVLFLGHDEGDLSREELLLATGLAGSQYIDELALPRISADIRAAFQDKGFHFVTITPEIRAERDEVAFLIDQGSKVRVGRLKFIGNVNVPSGKLVGTDLKGTVESGTGWLIFPGSPYVAGETERKDVVALQRLYADYGYLQAEIKAAEPVFYKDNRRVELTYEIEEGPLFYVGDIRIEAVEGAPALRYAQDELFDALRLQTGDPLEAARIARDEAALRSYYGALGHTQAQGLSGDASFFALTTERIVGEGNTIDVVFRIQEGEPKRIRDILITGNRYTQDRVIRRDISLEPGDLADMTEAARSHRRLLGSQYYLDERTGQPWVDYRFQPTSDPALVDLEYTVREGRGTGNILFGGGLSTNNGPFVSVNLQKSNFDITDLPSSWGNTFSEILGGEAFTGGGQTLRLFLAPGSEYSTYRLTFFEPDLLGEHISRLGMRVEGYKTYRFLRTHDEERTGVKLTLSRRFGRHFTIFGGPSAEKIRLTDIDPDAPAGIGLDDPYRLWKNSFGVGVQYSTVEDQFSPVDSGKIRLELRQNGEFMGGDMDYIEADLQLARYFGIFEDTLGRDWTLAFEGRVRRAWSDGDVPYTERYWLGGTRTLRGYDYRGVGRAAGGFAFGGEAAINATTELRFPILSARVREAVDEFQWVRGAFFVDAGTYGDDFGDLEPTRVSAGFGIRVRLPMMPQFPIALDFGWALTDERFDDERVFHLNFGEF